MTEAEERIYVAGGNAAHIADANNALRGIIRDCGKYTMAQRLAVLQALRLVSNIACADPDKMISHTLANPPTSDS